VKLATHLHLEPRSGMHGVISSLPQYASIAWCSVKAQRRLKLNGMSIIHLELSSSFRYDPQNSKTSGKTNFRLFYINNFRVNKQSNFAVVIVLISFSITHS